MAADFPKAMVRVQRGSDGQLVADVRLALSAEEETAITAEGYIPYDLPEPIVQKYPKWVYQKGGQRRIVQSEDEQKKLEGSWEDAPVEDDPPAEAPPKESDGDATADATRVSSRRAHKAHDYGK